ncbi:MAG: glycosyltransferase [Salinivirgaceae bacterium]|nr:glycosyltransferase [Salinivirgaceae bacterium]
MTYTIASLVFLAVSLAYAMLIIRIRFGFKKIAAQPQHSGANLAVSVLVPFHNEESTIQSTIESLLNQQTETDFEVIAIDDHSTDGSRGVVSAMLAANPRLHLIESNGRGKKNALSEAIAAARFNAIINTDADCAYPQGWLDAMAATFSHEKCSLLAAPVVLSPVSSWFQKFQFVDFASLVGSGIGAAGCRRPIMCNGANLMFDRLEYNKLTDPLNSKIASGDDVFLLHKMKAAGAKISFTAQPETIATTRPAPSAGAFLRQRTRWGGKATDYTDADSLAVAVVVAAESVLLCVGIAALPLLWKPALALYLTKLFADTLLLAAVCKRFGNRRILWWMPVFEIVVAVYTVCVAVAAMAGIGKKKWK